MENREDMQVVTVEQQAREEQPEQEVHKEAEGMSKAEFMAGVLERIDKFAPRPEDAPVTEREILARIDRIIAQGEELAKAVESIRDLPVSQTPGYNSARAEAIARMYIAREETNRKQLELLREMYKDMRQTDPLSAKKEILMMIQDMNFDCVSPETAKNVLDFYQRQLENL